MKQINWKYGLGEIAIVMIGILLAFQLQNWNEHRKEVSLIRSYLDNLKENLNQDQEHIGRQQAFLSDVDSSLKSLDKMLLNLNEKTWSYDKMKGIHELSAWYFLLVQNATFSDLYNAGRLNLLPDLALRLDLSNYYEYAELIKGFDVQVSETQRQYNLIIIENVPFSMNNWRIPENMRYQLVNMSRSIQSRVKNHQFHLTNLNSLNVNLIARIDGLN